MKTHDLADALAELSQKLRAAANADLKAVRVETEPAMRPAKQEIKIGLSLLLQLSRINKQDWLAFVKEHQFPIQVDHRDSSRNILGKLLSYLEKNPDAQKQIRVKELSPETSPELARALKALLGE